MFILFLDLRYFYFLRGRSASFEVPPDLISVRNKTKQNLGSGLVWWICESQSYYY